MRALTIEELLEHIGPDPAQMIHIRASILVDTLTTARAELAQHAALVDAGARCREAHAALETARLAVHATDAARFDRMLAVAWDSAAQAANEADAALIALAVQPDASVARSTSEDHHV